MNETYFLFKGSQVSFVIQVLSKASLKNRWKYNRSYDNISNVGLLQLRTRVME